PFSDPLPVDRLPGAAVDQEGAAAAGEEAARVAALVRGEEGPRRGHPLQEGQGVYHRGPVEEAAPPVRGHEAAAPGVDHRRERGWIRVEGIGRRAELPGDNGCLMLELVPGGGRSLKSGRLQQGEVRVEHGLALVEGEGEEPVALAWEAVGGEELG